MIFKDPKLKKYAIDLLFDLKNNTTIKGLYHKIDGCSLEHHPQVKNIYIIPFL